MQVTRTIHLTSLYFDPTYSQRTQESAKQTSGTTLDRSSLARVLKTCNRERRKAKVGAWDRGLFKAMADVLTEKAGQSPVSHSNTGARPSYRLLGQLTDVTKG